MKIAWLGLGIMGSRQAVHLARAGHELTVFNRTTSTAEAWAKEHGATVAATPAEAAEGVEVLFTMLVDGDQVAAALEGIGGHDGPVIVDMSTIGAAAAGAIAPGRRFVDAPVTGSAPKAADGTLTIMAGGDAADYAVVEPLLRLMGALVLHVGPVGAGQTIKVINNALSAVNANAVAQALIVGSAAGVSLDALVAVMGAGSGGSTMLGLKAQPMRDHDWTTLFKLDHMLKDVRLCLEEAATAGVSFPAAQDARDVLAAASERGLGEADFAALTEVVEARSGRRI